MESGKYYHYILQPEKSDENRLHYKLCGDKHEIIKVQINRLLAVRADFEATQTSRTGSSRVKQKHVNKAIVEAIYRAFYQHHGHTITADEEQFNQLFSARVHPPGPNYTFGYATMIEQTKMVSLGNSIPNEIVFQLSPQMILTPSSFLSDERLRQLADYVQKNSYLDIAAILSELETLSDSYDNIRHCLKSKYDFFNNRSIFVRPQKLALEYNPKRAAKQQATRAKRFAKIPAAHKPDIGLDEITNVYRELHIIITYAFAGEEIKAYNLSRSRISISKRIMPLINIVDAIYTKKPYRNLQSFHLLKQKIHKMSTDNKSKLALYDSDFVDFMQAEIASGPKKPQFFRNAWDTRRYKGKFLFNRIRRQFNYIRSMRSETRHR